MAQDIEAGITVRRNLLHTLMLLKCLAQFNVFWLDPEAPESFPRGLLDAMEDDAYTLAPLAVRQRALHDIQARTRLDMEASALQPMQPLDVIDEDNSTSKNPGTLEDSYDEETVGRTGNFLRLPVRTAALVDEYPLMHHLVGCRASTTGIVVPSRKVPLLFLVWGTIRE